MQLHYYALTIARNMADDEAITARLRGFPSVIYSRASATDMFAKCVLIEIYNILALTPAGVCYFVLGLEQCQSVARVVKSASPCYRYSIILLYGECDC